MIQKNSTNSYRTEKSRSLFAGTALFLLVFILSTAGAFSSYGAQKVTNEFRTKGAATYYYNASGKKATGWWKIGGKKYYFRTKADKKNPKGSMAKGLTTIGGKRYYFSKEGMLQTNKVIKIGKKRYFFNKDGYMKTPSILLVAGHGQGDPGAIGNLSSGRYEEYLCTREFTELIRKQFKARKEKLKITVFNKNYNAYQIMRGISSGPWPSFESFDYVLEIHFNATGYELKDPEGDGKFKGVGMYINQNKPDYILEQKIVNAISALGFKQWTIARSSGLLNARSCQEMGVSYGLLETAFIDDKDDMDFYQEHKQEMAAAVAAVIAETYGI